jgi:Tetratricopeptide repeat
MGARQDRAVVGRSARSRAVHRARAHHVQAVAAGREAQEGSAALEIALNNYAVMIARLGDLPAARPLLEESLLLARSRGEPSVIALTSGNLAIVALDAGELETAEALVLESLARAREVDFRGVVSSALILQSVILLARGNLDQACAVLAEAIEAARSIRHIETVASALSVAGTVAAMRHQPIPAATLWASSRTPCVGTRSGNRDRSSSVPLVAARRFAVSRPARVAASGCRNRTNPAVGRHRRTSLPNTSASARTRSSRSVAP